MVDTPRHRDHHGIESGFGNGSGEVREAARTLRSALFHAHELTRERALSGMCHEEDGSYFWMKGEYGTLLRVKVEAEW